MTTVLTFVTVRTDQESLTPLLGDGSPTEVSVSAHESLCERADSVSVRQGVNVHLLGATPHAGDGIGVTGGLREAGGCPSMEGAVGGVTSTAYNTLCSAPPRGHPVGQPIVFGHVSSGAVTANLGSHSSVPNLFGLPAPVYTGTVPAGVPSTTPTAAVCRHGRQEWVRYRSSRPTSG